MQIFYHGNTKIMYYNVLKVLIKLAENMQPSYKFLYT